jgi:hypothetical protein
MTEGNKKTTGFYLPKRNVAAGRKTQNSPPKNFLLTPARARWKNRAYL